ncbi:MAG TPA: ABC transporter permease [Tepidisphaeraceae bacterium]|jgi:peptide/nickel transport system permease protein
MSEVAADTSLRDTSQPSRVRSSGLVALAATDALRNRGVRLGLVWLAVIASLAVFAPLLANSRPILLKMDNAWSSPMAAGLQWSDVFVFVGTLGAGLLLLTLRRRGGVLRVLAIGILLLTTGTVSYLSLGDRTDRITVYSAYREAEAAGRVQWALRAPVPYSPSDYLRDKFDPNNTHPWAPRRGHWLGTENNGSDIASRMIHACRVALSVGFIAEGVSLIIGVTLGGLMGYFGGAIDLLGMRLIEIFSSIPQLYLLLTFVAFFDRNLYLIMLIIGLTSWTGYAVFIRAQFLSLRNQDFVHAARAGGLPTWRVVFLHMLPNGISPVLVSASFGVASAITAEASLSFLGLGPVDAPSWGQLLNQAVGASRFYWWLGLFPGIAIFFTVLAYNVIGEALRDALDPRGRKRE